MRERIPSDLAPPCTRAQMNKLGKRLVATETPSGDDLALYGEIIVFHDEIKSIAQAALDRHRWHKVLGRPIELAVTGRAKTRGTLMDKLRRTPGLGLGYIRDIAGVRIVGAVSLTEQDAIANAVGGLFGASKIIDLRDGSHMGYRAVHVQVEIAGGAVEVQVRTSLQAGWADLYERAGDRYGRGIRYGDIPDDPDVRTIVERMLRISAEYADFETGLDEDITMTAQALREYEVRVKREAKGKSKRGALAHLFKLRAARVQLVHLVTEVGQIGAEMARLDPSEILKADIL